jgi:hypothetical protein
MLLGEPLNASVLGMARSVHGVSGRKSSIGNSSLSIDASLVGGSTYIDGRYMLISEAAVRIMDWGYGHPDVTYDVVSVWDGRFFRLGNRLRRFRASMDKLRARPKESDEDIRALLHRLVRSAAWERPTWPWIVCGVRRPRVSPTILHKSRTERRVTPSSIPGSGAELGLPPAVGKCRSKKRANRTRSFSPRPQAALCRRLASTDASLAKIGPARSRLASPKHFGRSAPAAGMRPASITTLTPSCISR